MKKELLKVSVDLDFAVLNGKVITEPYWVKSYLYSNCFDVKYYSEMGRCDSKTGEYILKGYCLENGLAYYSEETAKKLFTNNQITALYYGYEKDTVLTNEEINQLEERGNYESTIYYTEWEEVEASIEDFPLRTKEEIDTLYENLCEMLYDICQLDKTTLNDFFKRKLNPRERKFYLK